MKDDPIRICPECDSSVKRLLYPVGIVFKGSGWYINDSRKPDKSESGADAKEGGTSETAKDGESGATESKPTETKESTGQAEASAGAKSEPKPAAGTA